MMAYVDDHLVGPEVGRPNVDRVKPQKPKTAIPESLEVGEWSRSRAVLWRMMHAAAIGRSIVDSLGKVPLVSLGRSCQW